MHKFLSLSLQESLCYCCGRLERYFKDMSSLPVGLLECRCTAAAQTVRLLRYNQTLLQIRLIHQIPAGATCLFSLVFFFYRQCFFFIPIYLKKNELVKHFYGPFSIIYNIIDCFCPCISPRSQALEVQTSLSSAKIKWSQLTNTLNSVARKIGLHKYGF